MSLDRTIETKKPSKEKGVTLQDLMKTDQATWEYVTVPATNVLDEIHPHMVINAETYEAGKTYLLPHLVAETLQERLKVYARSCIRILSPKKDGVAEQAVAMGSANAGRVGIAAVSDASAL